MCGRHFWGELWFLRLYGVLVGVVFSLRELGMQFMRCRKLAGKQRERGLHELPDGAICRVVGVDCVRFMFGRELCGEQRVDGLRGLCSG
jgi:hypothetical protein